MEPTMTSGRPYSARVEFFACREDVEAMLAKGYSARMAYEAMKKQGRVTCGYSAFCDYVRGGGKRLHSRKKTGRAKSISSPPKTAGPKIIRPSNEPFPEPKSMDIKDAI